MRREKQRSPHSQRNEHKSRPSTFMVAFISSVISVITTLSVQTAFQVGPKTKFSIDEFLPSSTSFWWSNSSSPTTTKMATAPSVTTTTTTTSVSRDRPPNCTIQQLEVIQSTLEKKCDIQEPWTQKCAYTQLTKCPKQTWLDEHIINKTSATAKFQEDDRFIAIYVGCNKGFDALNALRVGTNNPVLDRHSWREQFFRGKKVQKGVCNQEFEENPKIIEEKPRTGQVHCFEPMPSTVHALASTSKVLGYDKHGFVVVNAAMGKTVGTTKFPNYNESVGIENQGMGSCVGGGASNCVDIPLLTLDAYVKKNIPGIAMTTSSRTQQSKNDVIQQLSIDVEGFDFDVLLGGRNLVLPRVEYLEFEYNWMGSWANQKLGDAIAFLDLLGFTCYWAGVDKLWRISGCFLDELYQTHWWSNVACANRNLAPDLFQRMERKFLDTVPP